MAVHPVLLPGSFWQKGTRKPQQKEIPYFSLPKETGAASRFMYCLSYPEGSVLKRDKYQNPHQNCHTCYCSLPLNPGGSLNILTVSSLNKVQFITLFIGTL